MAARPLSIDTLGTPCATARPASQRRLDVVPPAAVMETTTPASCRARRRLGSSVRIWRANTRPPWSLSAAVDVTFRLHCTVEQSWMGRGDSTALVRSHRAERRGKGRARRVEARHRDGPRRREHHWHACGHQLRRHQQRLRFAPDSPESQPATRLARAAGVVGIAAWGTTPRTSAPPRIVSRSAWARAVRSCSAIEISHCPSLFI
jgi:hypothetical protein